MITSKFEAPSMIDDDASGKKKISIKRKIIQRESIGPI